MGGRKFQRLRVGPSQRVLFSVFTSSSRCFIALVMLYTSHRILLIALGDVIWIYVRHIQSCIVVVV